MAYNEEKSKVLEETFETVASLVGEKKVVDGHEVGLNLSLEKDNCLQSAQTIRDGIFKVVVMGTFSSGKSTVINALLSKDVLPIAIRPCTSVLTFVQYGDKDSSAEVHYKQEQNPDGSLKDEIIEKMSLDAFREKYQYTDEDDKEFRDKGKVKRFDIVSYAVVRIKCPLVEKGVKVIDSPGLKNNVVDNALSKKIATEANAIIYVGKADISGYDMDDRLYFDQYFRGCPNNVFFVINKFDLCKTRKDKEGVCSKVEGDLEVYFTRNDGTVDRELMSRRVFYVAALLELESRTGITEEYDSFRPLSEEERRNRSEKSGYADFERELEHFLTTDEKCKAEYQSNFKRLSNTYKVAEVRVKEDEKAYQNKSLVSEKERKECSDLITNIEGNIKVTEKTFDAATLKLQSTFAQILRGAVQNIDETWEEDMLEIANGIDFGMTKYLNLLWKQLNFFKDSGERTKEIDKMLEPFALALTKHFSEKINDNIQSNMLSLTRTIHQIEDEIGTNLGRTASLFNDLGQRLVNGHSTSMAPEKTNYLQQLISLYFGDFSEMARNGGIGGTPWIQFIKRTIVNAIWQATLLILVGGPLGLILIGGIEIWQTWKNKNRQKQEFLSKSKELLIKEISRGLEDTINDKNADLAKAIDAIKVSTCGKDRQRLQDEKARLHNIDKNISDTSFNYEAEKNRCAYVLNSIYMNVKKAYSVVFNKDLTLDGFVKL